MYKHKENIGFTLVEMAIVLVVIALIIAGVVVGQSMIRQSQVMSVIVDENNYIKAALAFRDKFNALPGDMTNADSYWGLNSTCPPTVALSKPIVTTCNGNGGGAINSDGTGTGSASNENFYAWQHLANAGFIPGGYTGARGATAVNDNEPGLNVPATRLPNGGFEWMVFNASSVYSTAAFFNIIYYQQYLLLGGRSGYDLLAPLLSSKEANSIDAKVDDGLPGTGTITTINGSTVLLGYTTGYNSCVSGSAYATLDIPACVLLFNVKW